jgi:hypothetical protein
VIKVGHSLAVFSLDTILVTSISKCVMGLISLETMIYFASNSSSSRHVIPKARKCGCLKFFSTIGNTWWVVSSRTCLVGHNRILSDHDVLASCEWPCGHVGTPTVTLHVDLEPCAPPITWSLTTSSTQAASYDILRSSVKVSVCQQWNTTSQYYLGQG